MFAGVGCFQEVEKDNEQRASFRPSKDWRSCLGEQGCHEHYDDQLDDDGKRNDNDVFFYWPIIMMLMMIKLENLIQPNVCDISHINGQ